MTKELGGHTYLETYLATCGAPCCYSRARQLQEKEFRSLFMFTPLQDTPPSGASHLLTSSVQALTSSPSTCGAPTPPYSLLGVSGGIPVPP